MPVNVFRTVGVSLLFSLSISCFSQIEFPPDRITFEVKNKRISEILEIITQQTGLLFAYNSQKIKLQKSVTYNAINKPVKDVLEELLTPEGVSFEYVENQIVLSVNQQQRREEQFTLSGFVKDEKNGEVLIGATVFVEQLGVGTVTNDFGFYSLTLKKGTYTIRYSFIGFETMSTFIHLTTSLKESVSMKESPSVLGEVVVSSSESESNVDNLATGMTNLRATTVDRRPSFFGETDVIKSLESVPGVKSHSDGSTFYYVRGGNRDQNVIFIDDAPVYNPSHLLGFFSTVIPDAVNDVKLYKGDMPASMGGRLSSVLDIETRKGNSKEFQAWGGASLIATRLGMEGPFKKDVSSYLLSGRLSRLAWIFRNGDNTVKEFGFWDLTGKVNFRLNEKNRLFFSFYSGRDGYFNQSNGIEWTNRTATLRWNHLFTDKLFLNTTLAAGEYDYFLHTDIASSTFWNSHISNFNLKTDFDYFISPGNDLTFGLALNGYNFNPGNLSTRTSFQAPVVSVRNAGEFALYAQHSLELNSSWGLSYGLRFSSWSNQGEAFEYLFDGARNPTDTLFYSQGEAYHRYFNAEPRATLKRNLTESSSAKLSVTRNIQNIHLITNSISPFTALEVWLPSSINIKPQTSLQLALGYYKELFDKKFSLEVETYFKRMKNQIDYEAHAETLLNPYLERELRFGEGRGYGLELLLRKNRGKLYGWIGYTWSRAKRTFAEINNGNTYNAFFDRPHQVNILLNYEVTPRWSVGMNWNYSTGSPYSTPTGFYYFNDQEIPIYGAKNNSRLPDYHRMDVSATLKLNKNPESKFKHTLSLSVYNFYGRKNILFVDYNKTQIDADTFEIPSNLDNADRITTQRYLLRFTPSITYNFKWK